MTEKIDRVFVDSAGLTTILRDVHDGLVVLEDLHGFRAMSIASFQDRYEEMPCQNCAAS